MVRRQLWITITASVFFSASTFALPRQIGSISAGSLKNNIILRSFSAGNDNRKQFFEPKPSVISTKNSPSRPARRIGSEFLEKRSKLNVTVKLSKENEFEPFLKENAFLQDKLKENETVSDRLFITKRNVQPNHNTKSIFRILLSNNYGGDLFRKRVGYVFPKLRFHGDSVGSEFLGKRGFVGSEFLGKRSTVSPNYLYMQPQEIPNSLVLLSDNITPTNFASFISEKRLITEASKTRSDGKINDYNKDIENNDPETIGNIVIVEKQAEYDLTPLTQQLQMNPTMGGNEFFMRNGNDDYNLMEKRGMGSEFLGKRGMGSEFLGKRRMGSEFLGKRRMGSEYLDKRRIGSYLFGKSQFSGIRGLRSEIFGKRKSGTIHFGNRGLGSEFLGKRAVGSEFLGKRAMGSEFLGKRAVGSEFLGKRAMGSEFQGKRAMGSEFLGKRAMGSEFLGKRAMLSAFSGNRTPGVNSFDKRGMGSEFLGKRQMETEFLIKRATGSETLETLMEQG